jgi:hypothetical protein
MPTSLNAHPETQRYRDHLDSLYALVERAVLSSDPGATFHRTPVDRNEEEVGPYEVSSLEISRPGKTAVCLVPRGIFVVGALGRVDARSRLGREVLMWMQPGGPALHGTGREGEQVVEQFTRPLYPSVREGWAWEDEHGNQLLPLTEDVLLNKVLANLTE